MYEPATAPLPFVRSVVEPSPSYVKYVGHRGWLGVYVDVPQDWEFIAQLVKDAYRMVAPKTLAAKVV